MDKPSRGNSNKGLDSIADGFREHERGLSDVIGQLRGIVESSCLDEERRQRVSDIEKNFSTVQGEISSLIVSLSHSESASNVREQYSTGPPVIVKCKQWEDFKSQALNAGTVSFLYRAEERTFQADAIKERRVYTFSGQLPSDVSLLRTWLSRELGVEESRVLEGILALG
jgi:hypothetical protein